MKIFFAYPGYFYPVLAGMLLLLFFYWRKKFARRDFSYLVLVERALQQLTFWQRWKNHFLLILRLGILFLIGAIFARPFWYWHRPVKSGSGIDIVVCLDNSFSLNWKGSGMTNFDRAREIVKRLKENLPENVAIALLSFGNRVNWCSEKFSQREEELASWLALIEPGNEETNLAAAVRQASRMLENRASPNKVILILTDGQRSFLKKENLRNDLESALAAITKEKIIVIEVNPEKLPNRSISCRSGISEDLTAQINNYGLAMDEPVFCVLRSQGKIIARKFFRLKETGTAEINFRRPELGEWGSLEISADNLIGDNCLYFVLPKITEDNILIFDGDPQFGSVRAESFYLRQALSAFNRKYRIAGENDFVRTTLQKYRWIILANWRLSESQAEILKEYLNNGGNILIFAGDKINAEVYNQQEWLPVIIGEFVPAKESVQPVFLPESFLPWPDFEWEKISVSALAVQKKDRSYSFLLLKNNRPLLVGNSQVYFVATTADRDWGNLAVKPVFSFILQKILSGPAEATREIPLMINTEELRIQKDSLVLVQMGQVKIRPATIEELAVYRSGEWEKLSVPRTLKEPGIYRIVAVVNNRRINQLVAVNFPPDFTESNLEKFSPADWRRISRGKVYYLQSGELNRVREIILGKPAELSFWLLLVIFLEIELLFKT